MTHFQYRKSSYSDKQAECVEVATNVPATIAIRDSKAPTCPSIHVRPITWTTFRSALTDGKI
jgi:hypothetical protein